MAGQYSLRSFLRHAPNALLQRYLENHGLGQDIDWEEFSETHVDPIVREIGEAEENARTRIEGDFRLINSMATEGGVQTIIDESREFPDRIDLSPVLEHDLGFVFKRLGQREGGLSPGSRHLTAIRPGLGRSGHGP